MKSILFSILFFSFSSFSIAGDIFELNCVNNDAYTDMGSAKIALNTFVIVNKENDYSLEEGNFYFYIEDSWTDQDVEMEEVKNYPDYKPRKYKGYAKFENIGKNFYGIADFLVPHKVLLNGESEFQGVFILSWVEDHWGGTITADCKLK